MGRGSHDALDDERSLKGWHCSTMTNLSAARNKPSCWNGAEPVHHLTPRACRKRIALEVAMVMENICPLPGHHLYDPCRMAIETRNMKPTLWMARRFGTDRFRFVWSWNRFSSLLEYLYVQWWWWCKCTGRCNCGLLLEGGVCDKLVWNCDMLLLDWCSMIAWLCRMPEEIIIFICVFFMRMIFADKLLMNVGVTKYALWNSYAVGFYLFCVFYSILILFPILHL